MANVKSEALPRDHFLLGLYKGRTITKVMKGLVGGGGGGKILKKHAREGE